METLMILATSVIFCRLKSQRKYFLPSNPLTQRRWGLILYAEYISPLWFDKLTEIVLYSWYIRYTAFGRLLRWNVLTKYMMSAIFLAVTPCNSVQIHLCSSAPSVDFCRTTWRCSQGERGTLRGHRSWEPQIQLNKTPIFRLHDLSCTYI
jgi:hypothetical protein